jgi:23S rRNA pseudouridine2605 synthase
VVAKSQLLGTSCTISEGRNRGTANVWVLLAHAVIASSIRYGAMLPRGLKRGAFVELDDRDIFH